MMRASRVAHETGSPGSPRSWRGRKLEKALPRKIDALLALAGHYLTASAVPDAWRQAPSLARLSSGLGSGLGIDLGSGGDPGPAPGPSLTDPPIADRHGGSPPEVIA